MCTFTNPDASVTLYYIHNKALLAYDTSLHGKDKSVEQYHTKMSVNISETSSKRTRKCRNIPSNNDNERNVTIDDLLSLSFSLLGSS